MVTKKAMLWLPLFLFLSTILPAPRSYIHTDIESTLSEEARYTYTVNARVKLPKPRKIVTTSLRSERSWAGCAAWARMAGEEGALRSTLLPDCILVLKRHCYNGAVPKTMVQLPLLPAAAARHLIHACVWGHRIYASILNLIYARVLHQICTK